MANVQAFDEGLNIGSQDAYAQRVHNQALSDQDLENKAQELVDSRKAIQQKLPSLMDADNKPTPAYHAAIDELTNNTQALRELYHPQNNPGAIQKFGHILTDHLHITNPEDRAAQQNAQQAALHTQDQQTAERLAAAAPLSGAQQAQTNAVTTMASVQSALKNYDTLNPHAAGPDATPEEKQAREGFRNDVIQRSLGGATKQNLKLYTLANGNKQWLDASRPELLPIGATADTVENADTRLRADYDAYYKDPAHVNEPKLPLLTWKAKLSAQGHTSTSQFNETLASYARFHGISVDQMTPDQYDYVASRIAQSKAIPTSTTTHTLKQNLEQQWVPITETNTKSPNTIALKDPLGEQGVSSITPTNTGASQPASTGKQSQDIGTTKANPKDFKKEAASRKPAKTSTSSKGSNSGVSVGQPMFAAPNKEYTDTKTAYHAAIDRTKVMQKNLTNALKGDQQAMLSMVANHIGMTLGAQKGARINQAVWNEAVASAPWLERAQAKWDGRGLLSGVTLAPEQMKQMVELAKERTEILKENLDGLTKELNQGVTNPSSGSSAKPTNDPIVDAIVKAFNSGKSK